MSLRFGIKRVHSALQYMSQDAVTQDKQDALLNI